MKRDGSTGLGGGLAGTGQTRRRVSMMLALCCAARLLPVRREGGDPFPVAGHDRLAGIAGGPERPEHIAAVVILPLPLNFPWYSIEAVAIIRLRTSTVWAAPG